MHYELNIVFNNFNNVIKMFTWGKFVSIMDAESLFKISRDGIPPGRSLGRPKNKMEPLNLWLKQTESPIKKKKK